MATLTVGSWGLTSLLSKDELEAPTLVEGQVSSSVDSPPADVLAARISPAPGIQPDNALLMLRE